MALSSQLSPLTPNPTTQPALSRLKRAQRVSWGPYAARASRCSSENPHAKGPYAEPHE